MTARSENAGAGAIGATNKERVVNKMVLDSGDPEKTTPLKPGDYGYTHVPGAPEPPPLERPPFTLKEIRDSIPSHCFNRSLFTSFYHLTTNLFICFSLFYAATYISYFPIHFSILLWPAYWLLQGAYMGGLWVLAHECGHQAFSDYQVINDTVGLLLHSFLLVPYHSWKITHSRHHLNSGNCENDEMFVPTSRTRLEQQWGTELLEESVLCCFIYHAVLSIVFFPVYLVFNLKGPEKYVGKNANHFSPTAVFFLPKHYNSIVLSDVGVFMVLGGLIFLGMNYGFENVVFYYGFPYLQVNASFVVATLSNHMDTYVPYFRSEEWSWLRGCLSTVDRSLGKYLDGVFHHVTDTHVCHHLFPSMPFYHAEEATLAFTKVLGKYRLKDNTPIFKVLCRVLTNCKFVEDNESIVFYKKTLN